MKSRGERKEGRKGEWNEWANGRRRQGRKEKGRRVGNGMGKTEGYREEREGQGEEIKERGGKRTRSSAIAEGQCDAP